jgi:Zn-finger nucleic acid-binding protein
MMNCPRDSSALEMKTVEETPIEVCPKCGGMFLEEGELNRIADPTPGDLEFSTVDLDTFEHEDGYGPIACPRDASPMGKVDFNVETGIILDYCRSCGGFWMDGKELIRINEEVKRLNDAAREVPDPPLIRLSQFFWNLPLPH